MPLPPARSDDLLVAMAWSASCAWRARAWIGVVALWLVLAACQERKAESRASSVAEPAPASNEPLSYELAGCAVVHNGPRCELDDKVRTLTLWVAGGEPLRARSDRGELTLGSVEAIDGGSRYALQVPAGVSWLVLEQGKRRARLPIANVPADPLLAEATALRAKGEIEAARTRLETGLATLKPELQDRARALLARIALSQGGFEAAVQGLRASMDAAYAQGRISDALYDARALAYTLVVKLHDYAGARQVLDRAEGFVGQDAASRALMPHYRGLLAIATGDVRNGLALFREAAASCARLDLRSDALLSRQAETSALALLGRHHEALRTQQRIIADFPSADDACHAVDVREQLVWLGIFAQLPADDPELARVRKAGGEARDALARCQDPWRKRNHAINAGLLALYSGDVAGAERAVAELATIASVKDVLLRAWELELTGRLALARGEPRAAQVAYQQALGLSQRAQLWDNEHLAQLGIGRSLQAQKRLPQAIEAYTAAEALMDRLLSGIPLGEGLGGFLHERDGSAQALVDLLVHVRKPVQALAVARHARARVIRSIAQRNRLTQLDARARAAWETAIARFHQERAALERDQADAWQLPADRLASYEAELDVRRRKALAQLDAAQALLQANAGSAEVPLVEPSAAEPLLALFPVADGVIGFLARGTAVDAERLPALVPSSSPAELGDAWLAPFLPKLQGVDRLRVALHGALAGFDVHAFQLQGAPVLERFAIAYGLDAAEVAPGDAAAQAGALIVADPTSDLPGALEEGDAVRAALGPQASALAQGEATRARVLAALGGAGSFHYAGHGQFAGLEGIDSGLRLADGWLSLGDVLALPRAPQLVVLSACEGAGKKGRGFGSDLGVAEAFIAAGSRAVVATMRPVADKTARALFAAFYAERRAHPEATPAAALRLAQLTLQKSQPRSDWSSFRILVP